MPRYHNPEAIAAPVGRYTHGIEVAAGARLLFVAGQVGIRPDGTTPPDARAQHEQAWANLKAILAKAGMSERNLVRINGFITRPDLTAIWRETRDRALGDAPLPASTLLVVSALARPEWVVEIEAVAAAE